jgi:hypothetical protein
VRDDNDSAVVRAQVVLEPGQRLEVEVVRRLVEEEQRGSLKQEARERRAHPPAARELDQRPRELGIPEAEPAQDDAGLRLEPVSAERLEAMLEVPVPRGERLVGGLVELPRQRFQLALDLPDLGKAARASPRTEPRASPAASWGR